jgi:hypothetical protein
MKVVVIGKRNIVVAFIYIIMGKVLSKDCPPIARFIDYFPYFCDAFSSKFLPYI